MRNRWIILAVLFVVRLTMAFQFQSVAAVAPLLGSEFGVNLADIGILIGLYFTPGLALALPGGAIGRRFGDKSTVLGEEWGDASPLLKRRHVCALQKRRLRERENMRFCSLAKRLLEPRAI